MCGSLVEFSSLLFCILLCFAKLLDHWSSGFLCGARWMHSTSPTPTLIYTLTHGNLSQLTNTVQDTACLFFHSHWSPLWVEISTLAFETNTFFMRNVFSGVLYPYSSDKTDAQKLDISTKINVWSCRRPHRHASCSAGVLCGGCRAVTSNTQPSVY